MGDTISALLASTKALYSKQREGQQLVKRWEKTGLLEGLNKQDKSNLAFLLENQAKRIIVEASQTGTGGTFTPGTGEQWAGVALPMVRKIFQQLASKDWLSVQPMSLPSGLVFYLDIQYGSNKDPFSQGGSLYGTRYQEGDSGFGNLAQGGLYGPGRFGYSINTFSASVLIDTANIFPASYADVGFNSAFSQSVVAGQIFGIPVPTSSLFMSNPNAVRSFLIESGSAITAATNLQAFHRFSGTNYIFFVTASAASFAPTGSGVPYTVYYSKRTDFNARGDFEDTTASGTQNAVNASGSSIAIPELNIQFSSETISAKERKLKSVWTPEFAQDINAYQNVDAEVVLTDITTEYISLEIDLEILDMLYANAPIKEYWSAVVGNQIDPTQTHFVSNTAGVFYTQMSWFQTLGIKMSKISNLIHQRTLRGGANFAVVSPVVATILESIPGFAPDTDAGADAQDYAFGVQKMGMLNSRWKIYKVPYITDNVILMGYKGNNFLDSGAVYAPYIPLIVTPIVYDFNTFTPRKGVMTRYALKMIRPEFYGKIYVEGLQVV